MTFGKYPDVSLARAPERHAQQRSLLAQSLDPMVQKELVKTAARLTTENSFASVASVRPYAKGVTLSMRSRVFTRNLGHHWSGLTCRRRKWPIIGDAFVLNRARVLTFGVANSKAVDPIRKRFANLNALCSSHIPKPYPWPMLCSWSFLFCPLTCCATSWEREWFCPFGIA